jgi:ABC-type branched-subunit amino acid transport system substrate-binding protein
VAVLVVVALAAAGCANASDKSATGNTPASASGGTTTTADLKQHNPVDEVGVTDKEIRVSAVASITNPLGGNYGDIADGINAYFNMVNSGGGIYGRQLKLVKVRDDLLGQNQAQVAATVAEDNVFAVFIAALLFTGYKTLRQKNVPTFGWNINQEWIGPTNFFPNEGALCFTCARPGLPWLAKKIGATKVGVLAYNVPQSADCLVGINASFKKFPTAKLVYTDKSLSFGVADLSAQVAKMIQQGVELVATCMDINGVFTLAKEMKKQGLKAVQSLPQGYDQAFMKANGRYFEGDYVGPRFLSFEARPQIPEMKKYLEWIGKANKRSGELSMHGWIAANQFVTGLKLAGPDFNRQKVIQALNGLTHFTADGLIAPMQHADPAKELTSVGELDCSNTVQVKNNTFVAVFGEPGKPWRCFLSADEKLDSNAPTALPQPKAYSFVNTGG